MFSSYCFLETMKIRKKEMQSVTSKKIPDKNILVCLATCVNFLFSQMMSEGSEDSSIQISSPKIFA